MEWPCESRKVKSVANGTHEAHPAFVLRDARTTPRERRQRVALLEFADLVVRRGRRRRRWLRPRSARRCRLGATRRTRARTRARTRIARHVRGRGQVRHGRAGKNVRRARRIHVRIVDARVVVIVCTGKGDGLVGRAGLRTADADLRAGWVELGAAD